MSAWPPPLLEEHPRSLRFVLAVVGPALFGIALGYFLGVSAGTYLLLSGLGVIGGIGAGFDHVGGSAGAKRGLLGGAISGVAILAAHSIEGSTATVELRSPGAARLDRRGHRHGLRRPGRTVA